MSIASLKEGGILDLPTFPIITPCRGAGDAGDAISAGWEDFVDASKDVFDMLQRQKESKSSTMSDGVEDNGDARPDHESTSWEAQVRDLFYDQAAKLRKEKAKRSPAPEIIVGGLFVLVLLLMYQLIV